MSIAPQGEPNGPFGGVVPDTPRENSVKPPRRAPRPRDATPIGAWNEKICGAQNHIETHSQEMCPPERRYPRSLRPPTTHPLPLLLLQKHHGGVLWRLGGWDCRGVRGPSGGEGYETRRLGHGIPALHPIGCADRALLRVRADMVCSSPPACAPPPWGRGSVAEHPGRAAHVL